MTTKVKYIIPELTQATLSTQNILESDPDGESGSDADVLTFQSNALKAAQIKRFNDDTGHRACLVDWIKALIPMYLILVFFLLLLNGFTTLPFFLSDAVLIAILSTTTVNVIGLAVIVLKGLFNVRINQS